MIAYTTPRKREREKIHSNSFSPGKISFPLTYRQYRLQGWNHFGREPHSGRAARSRDPIHPRDLPKSLPIPSPPLTPSFSVEKSKRTRGASTLRLVSGDKSRRDTRKSCREVRRCSKDNAQSEAVRLDIDFETPRTSSSSSVAGVDGWPVEGVGGGRIHTSTRPAGAHKPVFSPYTQTRCTKPGLEHRHE